MDNSFSLMGLAQKYVATNKGRFYCLCIDLIAEFDSMQHNILWYVLLKHGIGGNFVQILQSMYSWLLACVSTSKGLTNFFECSVGTR